MRRIAAFLVAGLLATSACAKPPAPPTEIFAKLPGGRRLAFTCWGAGSPTILLEAGWFSGAHGWNTVPQLLSSRYRVCADDRAGLGRSDMGPLPRDGTAIATDLDQGLRAAKIGGPFVLVGHSAGGLYVRHFLLRRRGDVIGMVLADATVVDQQARFEAVFGPGAGTLQPLIDKSIRCAAAAKAGAPGNEDCGGEPAAVRLARWTTSQSELETLFGKTSSRLEHDDRALKPVPLVVLTAQRTYPAGPPADLWIALHQELAQRSARGQMRVIDSGHGMMWEKPEAIARAVDDVVARAQAGR